MNWSDVARSEVVPELDLALLARYAARPDQVRALKELLAEVRTQG